MSVLLYGSIRFLKFEHDQRVTYVHIFFQYFEYVITSKNRNFCSRKRVEGERGHMMFFIKGEKYLKGGVDTMEDRMSQEKINEST